MCGNISKEEYHKQINEIIMLLEGKTNKIIKQLEEEMKEASEKQEYEKAAYLRDKKIAIERASERQKVSNMNENDIDVIGISKNSLLVCVEIFFVRQSKMIGREHYYFEDLTDMTDAEITSGFIKQFYIDTEHIPHKILMKEEIEDKEAIEIWLTNKAERKVEIKVPQKGEKLRLVEMAEKNAKVTLDNRSQDKFNTINELKEILNLNILPRKIETFDISNISGEYIVAGMCVLKDGVLSKKDSRRFKIKTVFGQDDPRCMEEVITRRLKHSINNSDGGFGKFPDVIFVDGGITQIRAAKRAAKKYNIKLPIYGMVKDNKHRTRALIDEYRNEIKLSDNLMNVITNFQDSVHDIAIEYHRKLRDKNITKSILDDIEGIGKVKKQKLLKHFGSIEKIKKASVKEISKIEGINMKLAEKINKALE